MKLLITFIVVIFMFILIGCPINQNFSPTIQKVSGPDGNVYIKTQTFKWLGSDTDGTISGYEYRKDGGSLISTTATQFTWSSLTFGNHKLEVRAKDNKGAYSNMIEWNFSYIEISIDMQKSFGGSGDDYSHSIQQTIDGGYIITGYSNSNDGDVSGNHGNSDYWVVKLDSSGNIVWQKSFGGTSLDRTYSIQQTTDGGYIIAGNSSSNDGDVSGNHGNRDYWIIKLSSSGNIVWQKCFGGTQRDVTYSIQQTSDGGYIIAGGSESNDGDISVNHGDYDYWIIKLDSLGNLLWQKSFGGTDIDYAESIQQTPDGGYIVAGSTESNDGDVTNFNGKSDYWIVKLNNSGNKIWQKCFGGSEYEHAKSINQTTDGGYVITGYSNSNDGDVSGNHGNSDYWVVKLNSIGNIVWQKSIGGSDSDYAHSINQTTDGGYVITGYSNSNDGDVSGNHGNSDYWVVKLNSIGNIVWQKSIGGSDYEYSYSMQQTIDGGYVITGYSNSNDGDVSGNHGNNDYWIVKISVNP